ncbi:maleylacetoacetate isomerase [Magnetospirillum sulfuroxidans]|uniref:Maleylacetoacetate isomerase n=1 Tax=Magnetospirillum sulfuroxidans TaxID=611300 RepID=A0ABS5I755_9PROT|nr:maleylacetoacetate isomerase [Magnetospirillum sulfuroxidans]MBR9970250.1 maleylacetoacetate isomerase [Magnetospirillum sulfuroxidans]
MKLYTYFRSSTAYRVRIALNLKGLEYEAVPIHLVRGGGEQKSSAYQAINPQALVPALDVDGQVLTQSLAIMEYLEETHPEPALLPADALGRARVRAIALAIACEIHPINNLRVLHYLAGTLALDQRQKDAWYRHWVESGLLAVEAMLAGRSETGVFCHGDNPGLADCCLLPQVFNAQRFKCDLAAMPTIRRIAANCQELPAFAKAAPEAQPDFE